MEYPYWLYHWYDKVVGRDECALACKFTWSPNSTYKSSGSSTMDSLFTVEYGVHDGENLENVKY